MAIIRAENQTERIYANFVDDAGSAITGAAPTIIIMNGAGEFLDFDDNTFKASGWTTRVGTMTETDATNNAGVYHYDFDTTGHATNDNILLVNSALATAANSPQVGELRIDDAWVKDIVKYDIGMNAVYDTGANDLTIQTWLEQDGVVVSGGVSSGSVSVYDEAGTLLFTESDAAADAQGVFLFTKAAPAISADQAYEVKCTIVFDGNGYVVMNSFMTVD